MTTGIDRSPATTSVRLAVGAAVVATIALAAGAPASLIATAPGLLALLGGLRAERRDVVAVGAGALFVGALLAGIGGAPVEITLLGAGLAVLAWDVAGNAFEMGAQMGRDASTREAELAHASGTAAVGLGAGGLGYALFAVAEGGRPLTAVVMLSFAAVLLASALRLRTPSGN